MIFVEAVFEGTRGRARRNPRPHGGAGGASAKPASRSRAKTGGSTFKNPPGHKAWQLIDEAGCRGLMHGAAQVSEKHCNFLINTGDATAADIEALGEEVRAPGQGEIGVDAGMGNQARWASPMTRYRKRIAVLMGGRSAEREVSPVVGPRRA